MCAFYAVATGKSVYSRSSVEELVYFRSSDALERWDKFVSESRSPTLDFGACCLRFSVGPALVAVAPVGVAL